MLWHLAMRKLKRRKWCGYCQSPTPFCSSSLSTVLYIKSVRKNYTMFELLKQPITPKVPVMCTKEALNRHEHYVGNDTTKISATPLSEIIAVCHQYTHPLIMTGNEWEVR